MAQIRFLAVGLALGVAALVSGAQQPAAEPSRGLTVEKNDLDLGSVMEGSDAVATFQLRNSSAVEIKILKAAPS
jgi:hypothetical protein